LCPVETLAGEQLDRAAIDARLNPVAIIFDLVDPLLAARRAFRALRLTGFEERWQHAFARTANSTYERPHRLARGGDLAARGMIGAQFARSRELLRCAATQKRGRFLVRDGGVRRAAGELILRLDQQPRIRFLAALGPDTDQMPTTLQAM